MKIRSGAALAACALAFATASLAPASASSAIVQWTFAGQLLQGTDYTGIFGEAPGSVMDGDTYSVTYTFDTTKGTFLPDPPGSQFFTGTPEPTGPFSAAVLTINGVSVSINPGVAPYANFAGIQAASLGVGFVEAQVSNYDPSTYVPGATTAALVYNALDYVGGAPGTVDAPFSSFGNGSICLFGPDAFCEVVTQDSQDTFISGDFALLGPGGSNGFLAAGYFDAGYGVGYYPAYDTISSAVSDAYGGAPEPATWTMVIVGLAGIGAALRASRRRSPFNIETI